MNICFKDYYSIKQLTLNHKIKSIEEKTTKITFLETFFYLIKYRTFIIKVFYCIFETKTTNLHQKIYDNT